MPPACAGALGAGRRAHAVVAACGVAELERCTWDAAGHITCLSACVQAGPRQQGVPRRARFRCSRILLMPATGWCRAARAGPVKVGFVGAAGLRKGVPVMFEDDVVPGCNQRLTDHPGRGGPGATGAAPGRAPATGVALSLAAAGAARPRPAGPARLGAVQPARLQRTAAPWGGPACGDAGHAGPGHRDPARHHVRASGTCLCRPGNPVSPCRNRSARDGCILLPLFPGPTGAEQDEVAEGLRAAMAMADAPATAALV